MSRPPPGSPSLGAGRGCAATKKLCSPASPPRSTRQLRSSGQPTAGNADHRLGWNIQNVPGTGFEGVNDAVLEAGAREAIIGVGGTQVISAFRGEFLIARYTVDGDIDTHFSGPNGAIETPFPDGAGSVSSCVYDPQAKTLTVAGGVFTTDRAGVGLARYLLSG